MAIKDILSRKKGSVSHDSGDSSPTLAAGGDASMEKGYHEDSKVPLLSTRTFFMAVLVSMGGIVFGFDTGQISGFLEMQNFKENFADEHNPLAFGDVRSGLIVGMLSIGTLIGALVAAPVANTKFLGRKYSICLWCAIFCVGIIVQISSLGPHWYQLMIGRIIAGLGVGALSVLVPMYQGECAPAHVRGAIVCCYQLFITVGILLAYLLNFGTERIKSPASWKIVIGISFLWPLILGVGILSFPETPRFEYRNGKIDSARRSIAKFHGVSENHKAVGRQMQEMQEKLEAEQQAGDHPWYEVFTGPRMPYRIPLGMITQALQQLTGANYFFYYGSTVIFSSVGISNSFITQIILGAVNVVTTFPGLYFVEKYGRRKCLTAGAAWMFMCFMIFASVGQFGRHDAAGNPAQTEGYVMIIFACLFIAAFASTWGPMAWAVIAEIYPGRYRSEAIALCSGSNWTFNFLLAFFTPFITTDIKFAYGYVFAGCNLFAVFFVYFFLPETQSKSLEEIDTMFLMEIKPWKSSKWEPPQGEDLVTADKLMLNKGASRIDKRQEGTEGVGEELKESMSGPSGSGVGSDGNARGSGVRGHSFVGRHTGAVVQ